MSDREVFQEATPGLAFPGGRQNGHDDFLVRANVACRAPDVLAFFDSRGVGARFAGSLAEKFVQHMEAGATAGARTYLLVCRPLELTTWATLLNFLAANALEPRRVVTNMGFVDHTPKKQSILDDAIRQVELLLGPGNASSHFVEQYAASDGEQIPLFAVTYGEEYRRRIELLAAARPLLVINTPLVSPLIRIPRHRPRAFFDALEQGNRFNRSIRGARVVDLPDFDERHTYDAVHYTDAGNDVIFERIREHLQS